MNAPVQNASWGLTEKEKQTLRLMVRGHDAKSIARCLDLSVHTINERLRDARRKMAVSSSREAARLLLEAESGDSGFPAPDSFGDTGIGDDPARSGSNERDAPVGGAGRTYRHPWIIIGVLLMTLALGLLALATFQPAASTLPLPAANASAPHSEAATFARQWLALLDQSRWDDSYRETGPAFQKQNTAASWAAASEKARVPLGAVVSRTWISEEDLPAPPYGYRVVKFRTDFASKANAVETVTLERAEGTWRVVGVTIE